MIPDAIMEWFYGVFLRFLEAFPVVELPSVDTHWTGNNIQNLMLRMEYFLPVSEGLKAISMVISVLIAKGVLRLRRLFLLRF